jgi:hypothetical protein
MTARSKNETIWYHNGFFDAADGVALEPGGRDQYRAGHAAFEKCKPFFDRAWEDVPADIQALFPAQR